MWLHAMIAGPSCGIRSRSSKCQEKYAQAGGRTTERASANQGSVDYSSNERSGSIALTEERNVRSQPRRASHPTKPGPYAAPTRSTPSVCPVIGTIPRSIRHWASTATSTEPTSASWKAIRTPPRVRGGANVNANVVTSTPRSDGGPSLSQRVHYAALVRAIVLPVKSLDESKGRLTPVLSPLERAALTLAMLEDVMDATLAMPGWETWVVSPDETVLEIAARRGAASIVEERPPLANAIRQVEVDATERGADALAVLLPDTPFATAVALTRALHTLGPVVLAPATDETGTNFLLRRPPDAIASEFGPDSYRRHLEAAAEADIPVAVISAHELAFDVDDPSDILTLASAPRAGRTAQVIEELDLPGRATRAPGSSLGIGSS
jgi:2-phospho-L-lactate guanylyltransferase